MKRLLLLFLLILAVLISAFQFNYSEQNANADWAEYLGGPDRNHYSSLTQITPENVKNLQVAWTYAAPTRYTHLFDKIFFGK